MSKCLHTPTAGFTRETSRVWTYYDSKRLKYSVNKGGVRCAGYFGANSRCTEPATNLQRSLSHNDPRKGNGAFSFLFLTSLNLCYFPHYRMRLAALKVRMISFDKSMLPRFSLNNVWCAWRVELDREGGVALCGLERLRNDESVTASKQSGGSAEVEKRQKETWLARPLKFETKPDLLANTLDNRRNRRLSSC